MKTICQQMHELVAAVKPELSNISPDEAGHKEGPDAWSKKEILGHLIDSAVNNHHRFVRGAQNAAEDSPTYEQDTWVAMQRYNDMEWTDIIELFARYSLHLCKVIAAIPTEALINPCNFGTDNPVTLEFVITDYLRHMRRHLEVILGPLG